MVQKVNRRRSEGFLVRVQPRRLQGAANGRQGRVGEILFQPDWDILELLEFPIFAL